MLGDKLGLGWPGMCGSWKEVLREGRKGHLEEAWANHKVFPEGPSCQQRKAEDSFLGIRDLRKISEEVSKGEGEEGSVPGAP